MFSAPATTRLLVVLSGLLLLASPVAAQQIEKWQQLRLEFQDATWSGIPYDVDFKGTFTSPSGRQLTQFGFYAGNDIWKLYFMCDEIGSWTYVLTSNDDAPSAMSGQSGGFECVPNTNPLIQGQLEAAGTNRWKFSDGDYDAPIVYPVRAWFRQTPTPAGVGDFVDWMDSNGGTIVGIVLLHLREPKATRSQEDRIYVDADSSNPITPDAAQFYLPVWDRLNSHYDYIRDTGLGHRIMIFADDQDEPPFSGGSAAELRLFRYLIARLAPYPTVIWDSGIDIGGYRSNDWINNEFNDWFLANDPWQHPIGSRHGGGSGGTNPSNSTYDSRGATDVPDYPSMVTRWEGKSQPIMYSDHWRQLSSRGSWEGIAFNSAEGRYAIRGTAWQVGLVGGTSAVLSARDPEDGNAYLHENYATLFTAAPDIGVRTRFFRQTVNNLGALSPDQSLLTSGSGVMVSADPGSEYVAYATAAHSASFELDLSAANGPLTANWINVLTGDTTTLSGINGGAVVSFTPPDASDWVLHVFDGDAPPGPPSISAFTAAPNPLIEGDTVTYTLTATDPDDATLSYSIDVDDDGISEKTGTLNSGATTTYQHVFTGAGMRTARATVTDPQSQSVSATVDVDVLANDPPPAPTGIVVE